MKTRKMSNDEVFAIAREFISESEMNDPALLNFLWENTSFPLTEDDYPGEDPREVIRREIMENLQSA